MAMGVQVEVPTFMYIPISIKASVHHNPSICTLSHTWRHSLDEGREVRRPMAVPHPTHSVVTNSALTYIRAPFLAPGALNIAQALNFPVQYTELPYTHVITGVH